MNRPRWTGFAAIGLALVLPARLAAVRASSSPSPGIYLEKPGARGDDARIKLEEVTVQQVKQKGMFKMIATQGLLKGAAIGVIAGASAAVRAPEGDVSFDFYLDPKGPPSPQMSLEDAMQMVNGSSSMPSTARSAEDFVLVRLTPKDDTREVELGKGGSSKLEHTLPCTVDTVGNGAFRVRPRTALPPGEYAFTYVAQGQSGGQLWTFGVNAR